MEIRRLLLSKMFWYILIALILTILLFLIYPIAKSGDELAGNFLAEMWGLYFALGFFVMLFELRERLEWKSVENRVEKRIGKQIRGLFAELSILCKIERAHVDPLSKKKQAELVERQLDTLASENIEFTLEAKKELLKEDLRRSYERFLDSRANNLVRIEERYSRFLDSEVQTSLMDIQDYLDGLSLEFRIRHIRDEDFFKSVSYWIGKIMREISKLKRKGLWVNW